MSLQTQMAAGLARVVAAVVALNSRAPAAGGTTGQVWTKNSNTDHDASWQTPPAGGGAGDNTLLVALNSLGGF